MTNTKIVMLTGVPSPFQVELGEALRQVGVNYHIGFDSQTLADRGSHWTSYKRAEWVTANTASSPADFCSSLLRQHTPRIVLVGAIWGPRIEAAIKYASTTKCVLGVIAEQPSPRGAVLDLIRSRVLQRTFRKHVRFVLAIGDRAFDSYVRILGRPQDVYQVAYYQNLEAARHPGRVFALDHTRFLFSGRLLRRNRPLDIVSAFTRVAGIFGRQVSLVISAHGPEEENMQRALASNARVRASVSFDRDFATWNERLGPIKAADVLLVPASHSGWGLVVPEALAAGATVIATRQVEAARAMLRHQQNGLFCEPHAASLGQAMEYLCRRPERRVRMQRAASSSVEAYSANAGARVLADILAQYMPSET